MPSHAGGTLRKIAPVVVLPIWLAGCSPARPTPVVTALVISCDAISMNTIGQQSHCAARVSKTDGSTTDVSATAQWSSSDATKVTVNSGMMTAVAPGAADVVVTFEGVTGRQAITVRVGCGFSVSPDLINVGAGGGSQMVTVTAAPAGCSPSAWTATTSDASVSISPAAGDGNGTVAVTVSPNTTTSARSHAITIAGQAITVTQAAPAPAPAPTPAPAPPAPPTPTTYTLSLTLVEGSVLSGPHAGTVTGPDGFTCTFGLSKGDGACSHSFAAGTVVRLVVKLAWPWIPPGAPTPSDPPIGSSQGCDSFTGLDTCLVNLTSDRRVTIGVGGI